jgi:hypothetical protein
MEHFPESPDDVIDPRWNHYLHADTALGPAHHPDSTPELGRAMAELIEPWQAGRQGSRETLEALRQLANRVL